MEQKRVYRPALWCFTWLLRVCALLCALSRATSSEEPGEAALPAMREDFQLQIMAHQSDRQFGATLNIFCRYRYRTASDTFDYRDARDAILRIIHDNNTAIPQDAFWEVLNREVSSALWQRFPIRGVSTIIQVQGLSSDGIPGHRSSIVTMGDMEPLAFPNLFGECSGEELDYKLGAECRVPSSRLSTKLDSANNPDRPWYSDVERLCFPLLVLLLGLQSAVLIAVLRRSQQLKRD